jgi:glycosyltransferase involved in cell wall biosynthesis
MNIAHVTATFPPYLGGTGLVCYHNALELSRRGHRVTVYTAATVAPAPPPAEFAVTRLPALLRFGNAPILPGLLGLRGYDVIHLHYPFYSGAEFARLAAWRSGTPLVVTYHQDVLLRGGLNLIAQAHRRTLEAWVLGTAQRVLFTTLDYAGESKAGWLLRRRPAHVGELPNGVDVHRFRPGLPREAMRRTFNLRNDDIVFILVAGLDEAHYFKGVKVALQALARLPEPRAKFLIVGEGDRLAGYRAEAAALGLVERVRFAGRVSDDDLPLCYAAADACVLPSVTMGEAFGMVLLEAMACARPVIASRLPGVRTVVADEDDGLLATPRDPSALATQMERLALNPALRRAMGTRGRAKVEANFTWPRLAEKLEAVYASVVEHGAPISRTPVTSHVH